MKPKNQNQKLLVTGNAKGVLLNLQWRLMMLQDEKLRKQKAKVKVNFFKKKSYFSKGFRRSIIALLNQIFLSSLWKFSPK